LEIFLKDDEWVMHKSSQANKSKKEKKKRSHLLFSFSNEKIN
jgi:hypothetical protein